MTCPRSLRWLLASGLLLWAPFSLAEDMVLGMSAAFSGPSRSLGIELYRGSKAYLDWVNEQGGVHGRQIVLQAYDDAYDPNQTVRNTLRLVEQDDVFLLFNYVGTPTVTRVLPLIKQYADRPMYLFFPFTGAEPQRRPPYWDLVFNLRASYHDETAALVARFLAVGRERIGVFYQADAYGRGGWEGVRNALLRGGREVQVEATYRRGFDFDTSLASQVEILRAADPDAVIAICAYAACAALVRDMRDVGWDVPVANLSFSGSEAVAALLGQAGEGSAIDYGRRLITSQVVPSYQNRELPAIIEYRQRMDALGPELPPGAVGDYHPQRFSFTSLEGFLNAKLLVAVLQRLGPQPERAALRQAVEDLREVDLGIGVPLAFGPARHQASEAVFFTTLEQGLFVPVEDWTDFRSDP